MNFNRKNLFLKTLIPILIILFSLLIIYFIITKNSDSEMHFKNFMNLYTSKNIEAANDYIFNEPLPKVNEIFSENIKNSNDSSKNEIISTLENLFYSIDYKIISSKTILNKSTININFDYYDLSRHIINFFKTQNESEYDHNDFINSLKTTKYKISTNLNVELIKKNNQWNIVLSENLINILTAGLYKNFVI